MMSAKGRGVVTVWRLRRADGSDGRDTTGGGGRERRGQAGRGSDAKGREIERQGRALNQIFRESLAGWLEVAAVRWRVTEGRGGRGGRVGRCVRREEVRAGRPCRRRLSLRPVLLLWLLRLLLLLLLRLLLNGLLRRVRKLA